MLKMVMRPPETGFCLIRKGRKFMPMVTVSISPQQAAGIRAAVDNGGYASSSEVVREALRLWDTARKLNEFRDDMLDDDAPSGGRCVADMFADHEAERRRSA
jgi:antitoxin ParD1/3/4